MRRVFMALLAVVGLGAGVLQLAENARLSAAPAEAHAGIFILQAAVIEKSGKGPADLRADFKNTVINRAFIAVGVVLAAALALVLSLRHLTVPAGMLRDSLAIGSASLGYAMAVHPWLWLKAALPETAGLALACLALAGTMISLWQFGRFAAHYPQPVQETDLPERRFEWHWAYVIRKGRERGVGPVRAMLDDFKRAFDPTAFTRFLRAGDAVDRDAPGKRLLDRKLHRTIQGHGFVAVLCVLIALAMLATTTDSKGVMAMALATLSVLWLFLPAFLYLPACMHYWEIGYARGDEAERRTIRWMLASIYLSVTLYITLSLTMLGASLVVGTGLLTGAFAEIVLSLIMWLFPGAWFLLLLAIAASIFLRGAVEPTLVLKRSMLYGIIVVSMTAIFVAVENLLQSQAIARLGLPEQATVIITGTLVALLLGPLRDRIERRISGVIDRLLPPEPEALE